MPERASNFRSFPLAVFVAATMFWFVTALGVVSVVTVTFNHGALAGLNAILPLVISAAFYATFYVCLRRGSAVAAMLFALLGLWNFFDAVNGSPDVLDSIADIISGVLGVVGIAGVWKGFISKALIRPPNLQ